MQTNFMILKPFRENNIFECIKNISSWLSER